MARSVLLVDDDPAFRDLARRVLSSAGLAVVGEADTAAAALAAAKELRPDTVLVDVGLPDRDGVALARDLVALPWRPRVVVTSVDADATRHEEVRAVGADGFAPKDELPEAGLRLLLASAGSPQRE
jgi:DNA-binding NarL/FixJ family response regulator